LGLSLSWVCLMNYWAPGNPNLLGLGQPHLGSVYQGAYKARVFATGTNSSFFATNIPNPLL
jgi:hypothetical protein